MDHKTAYYLVLAITLIAAFWWGRASERWGATTALLGSVGSTIVALNQSWANLAIDLFVIDCAVLASFWTLSFHSHRYWPYWVTGWQLVAVLTHVQRALFSDILPVPYALLSMYLAYPMLALILFASFASRGRSGRTGN